MSSSFELFKQQIDDAVDLIEKTGLADINSINTSASSPTEELVDTDSLLNRCEKICESYKEAKPTIRIVHHLACSGGSLISKCLSSLPNVYLLSEVHPFTYLSVDRNRPQYAPTDIISLMNYSGIPNQQELAESIFKESIDLVYKHVHNLGGQLILRDHTHADFNSMAKVPNEISLRRVLSDTYNIKSILTIRHPLDSYASLVRNNWVHFQPKTFNEYCSRLCQLLKFFPENHIYRYEDFINDPKKEMKKIAIALELNFDDSFEDIFDVFKVTGDSGRTSDIISSRDRAVPENVMKESECSEEYLAFIEKYKLYRV